MSYSDSRRIENKTSNKTPDHAFLGLPLLADDFTGEDLELLFFAGARPRPEPLLSDSDVLDALPRPWPEFFPPRDFLTSASPLTSSSLLSLSSACSSSSSESDESFAFFLFFELSAFFAPFLGAAAFLGTGVLFTGSVPATRTQRTQYNIILMHLIRQLILTGEVLDALYIIEL